MENFVKALLFSPVCLFAHMENHQVVKGEATVTTDGTHQTIKAADKTVLHCSKFNIGKNEIVQFVQPSSKSAVLCRVTGKEASFIEGKLVANGRLVLLNPNSIYFRETAKVDVHTLVASTLDLKDEDFLQDKYNFKLESKDSCIVNKGQITAKQAVFLAPQIVDQGVIKAKLFLLGGDQVTLNFEGDDLLSFAIDQPLQAGFIETMGKYEGTVYIRLKAAKELIKNVVNVNGLIEATAMQKENGIVRLVGSISADQAHIEGRVIETAADYTISKKIDFVAEDEIRFNGGKIGKKMCNAEISFRAPSFINKGEIRFLGTNKILFSSADIRLGAGILASNNELVFDGPVTLMSNVKIDNGNVKGKIVFNSTLRSDATPRTLSIENASDGGIVSFAGPIDSLEKLSIQTGKIFLPTITNVHHLDVSATHLIDCAGDVTTVRNQKWQSPVVHLKGTQYTSRGNLVFSSKIILPSEHEVVFQTNGGDFEYSSLQGDRSTVTIQTGRGLCKLGNTSGVHLNSYGRETHIDGKIDAESIFIEALENIVYAAGNKTGIESKGDVTLNAKRGNVGTNDMRLLIKAEGALYVGGDNGYLEGECKDGYPHNVPTNPPTCIYFNNEQYKNLRESLVAPKPEEKISLTSDLHHPVPYRFVTEVHLTAHTAPLYCVTGKALIGKAEDEEEK